MFLSRLFDPRVADAWHQMFHRLPAVWTVHGNYQEELPAHEVLRRYWEGVKPLRERYAYKRTGHLVVADVNRFRAGQHFHSWIVHPPPMAKEEIVEWFKDIWRINVEVRDYDPRCPGVRCMAYYYGIKLAREEAEYQIGGPKSNWRDLPTESAAAGVGESAFVQEIEEILNRSAAARERELDLAFNPPDRLEVPEEKDVEEVKREIFALIDAKVKASVQE
jgi:hypothetical protein